MNDLLKGIGNVVNPKRVFRELTDFKPGEFVPDRGHAVGAVGVILVSKIFRGRLNGLISGLCIVFNLILVDRGRLTNYLWGFIGCATWLIVAIMNHLVGDIFAQIFYVTMQFVGVWVWRASLIVRKKRV